MDYINTNTCTHCRCLHSLTRSTKLLRTTLSDCEMWQPCLEVLCLAEEELLVMATGVMCNLLLAFSPSREVLDSLYHCVR